MGDPADPREAVQPVVRKVLRRCGRTLAKLHPIARALWKDGGSPARWCAVHLLAAAARKLESEHWKELNEWARGAAAPDLCDGVASELMGALVRRDRTWCRVLRHLAESKDPWERRAAASAALPRVRLMGDVEAGLSICELLMREPKPLVQEAVAALLRESLEADGEETREFLDRWRRAGRSEILDAVER